MAYATPTLALSGNTATLGVPSWVTATLTSTGTVGVTITASNFGSTDPVAFGRSTLLTRSPGAGSQGVTAHAAAETSVANAGSAATTICKIPVVFHKTGTCTISANMEMTRDDSGVRVQVFASDLSVTVS